MRVWWSGTVVFLIMLGIVYILNNQEVRSEEIRKNCIKTDFMVQRYKGGWTHVYDCSNKGEINE